MQFFSHPGASARTHTATRTAIIAVPGFRSGTAPEMRMHLRHSNNEFRYIAFI
jgi:hypothetical protein